MNRCILCLSRRIVVIGGILAQDTATKWKNAFGIDITGELKGYDRIPLHHCMDCGLEFFPPELAGSAAIYSKLQKHDWYYLPHKWEYDVALHDVPRGSDVLEIGCGTGDLLEQLKQKNDCRVFGIELNAQAAGTARTRGVPIYEGTLHDLSQNQDARFDVICHFQVLEHVSDPNRFIADCLVLLKNSGYLLIGVPDRDGFIRLDPIGLLNRPPHHISWWNGQVFKHVADRYAIKLLNLAYEPLAGYHLKWYLNLQLRRIPYIPILSDAIHRVVHLLLFPFLLRTRFYRLFHGHSLYARFQKTP